VRGDLGRVGDLFASFGCLTLEASARLFGGEEATEDGRRAEGAAQIERALAFHRSVGAEFLVRRGEDLLAATQSESA
jgi:hypothetical protein